MADLDDLRDGLRDIADELGTSLGQSGKYADLLNNYQEVLDENKKLRDEFLQDIHEEELIELNEFIELLLEVLTFEEEYLGSWIYEDEHKDDLKIVTEKYERVEEILGIKAEDLIKQLRKYTFWFE